MSRGGAPNRMIVILMIQATPPPRPACYSTDQSWRDWLVGAHLSGLRVVRRVEGAMVNGRRQTSHRLLPTSQIPYCDSCTAGHQRAMNEQGRCHPCAVEIREAEAA